MQLFTQKTNIMPERAMIGECGPNGDMCWNIVDFNYAWSLLQGGVLEDRGYKTVNGITYKLFYLPPAKPYIDHSA